MKFKNDGAGWRDLKRHDEYGTELTVSVDLSTKGAFVSIKEDGMYTAFHMSRKRLRKIAHTILKELDR